MVENAHQLADGALDTEQVWRGQFICRHIEGSTSPIPPRQFAMVVIPKPGDTMKLWDAEGELVLESDEVVASLVRHGRLYVKTRSEAYRIFPADDGHTPGAAGETFATDDDDDF